MGTDLESYFFEQGIKDVKIVKMNYHGFLFQGTNQEVDELVHMDDKHVLMNIKEFTNQ
ncbi:hypothetical protein J6W32_04740 [bacterium]|nr:hypothetical protein [bacterium]MBP5783867.1 hypothetical protein [bacterium]